MVNPISLLAFFSLGLVDLLVGPLVLGEWIKKGLVSAEQETRPFGIERLALRGTTTINASPSNELRGGSFNSNLESLKATRQKSFLKNKQLTAWLKLYLMEPQKSI